MLASNSWYPWSWLLKWCSLSWSAILDSNLTMQLKLIQSNVHMNLGLLWKSSFLLLMRTSTLTHIKNLVSLIPSSVKLWHYCQICFIIFQSTTVVLYFCFHYCRAVSCSLGAYVNANPFSLPDASHQIISEIYRSPIFSHLAASTAHRQLCIIIFGIIPLSTTLWRFVIE